MLLKPAIVPVTPTVLGRASKAVEPQWKRRLYQPTSLAHWTEPRPQIKVEGICPRCRYPSDQSRRQLRSKVVQGIGSTRQHLVLNPFRDWQPMQVMHDGCGVGRPLWTNCQSSSKQLLQYLELVGRNPGRHHVRSSPTKEPARSYIVGFLVQPRT